MTEENGFVGNRDGVPETLLDKLALIMFGARTRRRQGTATTTTQPVIVVPGNPNRVALTLINNSNSPVYVGFNPDTSATNGIILVADGGAMTMVFRDHGSAMADPLYALSGVAGKELTYTETELWGV